MASRGLQERTSKSRCRGTAGASGTLGSAELFDTAKAKLTLIGPSTAPAAVGRAGTISASRAFSRYQQPRPGAAVVNQSGSRSKSVQRSRPSISNQQLPGPLMDVRAAGAGPSPRGQAPLRPRAASYTTTTTSSPDLSGLLRYLHPMMPSACCKYGTAAAAGANPAAAGTRPGTALGGASGNGASDSGGTAAAAAPAKVGGMARPPFMNSSVVGAYIGIVSSDFSQKPADAANRLRLAPVEDHFLSNVNEIGQHVVPGSPQARLVAGKWRYLPPAQDCPPPAARAAV